MLNVFVDDYFDPTCVTVLGVMETAVGYAYCHYIMCVVTVHRGC